MDQEALIAVIGACAGALLTGGATLAIRFFGGGRDYGTLQQQVQDHDRRIERLEEDLRAGIAELRGTMQALNQTVLMHLKGKDQ